MTRRPVSWRIWNGGMWAIYPARNSEDDSYGPVSKVPRTSYGPVLSVPRTWLFTNSSDKIQ